MVRAEFTIPGPPQGKGRPRFSSYGGRVHTRTPEQTVLYENLVKTEYERQCPDREPFAKDVPLEIEITARFAPPESVSKKKRTAMLEGIVRPTKVPDADNVAKIILDALHGVCYLNDSSVVKLVVTKVYDSTPRVDVTVREAVGA